MKIRIIFMVLAMAFIGMSCNEKDADIRDAARQSLPERPASDIFSNSSTSQQAAPVSGVFHYICPNNCEGGGGDIQGNCPVCGTALEHNQAYHDQPINVDQPAQSPTITPPATTPEPAQNAAGVWHYTCSNGCAGGAGSAVACATCGSTLVHNQAYHN